LDATHILPEISISNAHMRVHRLRKLGYLNVRMDDVDNRRKFVEPTDAANKYFAQRSKLMEKAASK
jgi:DNA-binding MarR family transcriptional regulator